jgi:predicted site-specific integrase-resolvase
MLHREIETIVVAHKDRLYRFAYEFIEQLADLNDCDILVANQESLSPQQELVEDLMAIVHCFSCRLYGLRNYTKQIQETVDKCSQSEGECDEVQC